MADYKAKLQAELQSLEIRLAELDKSTGFEEYLKMHLAEEERRMRDEYAKTQNAEYLEINSKIAVIKSLLEG